MRSFETAYSNSREKIKAQKQLIVEQQHFEIVSAMKKTFGIDSFSALDESEKESYRSMLHKMWNKDTGLTEAGEKFIKESAIPLTDKSTPEQIARVLRAKVKHEMENILSKLSNGNGAGDVLKGILAEVKTAVGPKNIKKEDAVKIFKEEIASVIMKKIRF